MKLLVSFLLALLVIFASTCSYAVVTKVTTVTKTTVVKYYGHCKSCHHPCRHHYRHKKHYAKMYRTYYAEGYCVRDCCACGGVTCYPGRYYRCRTDYYYHSGRNTARVEVCN